MIDLNTFSSPRDLDINICIVGTGPAGAVIAKKLNQFNIPFSIFEGGNVSSTKFSQNQYIGKISSSNNINSVLTGWFPLHVSRLRFLGGASNHWSGRLAPFTQFEMKGRNWLGLESWPVNFSEFYSYYREALSVCGGGSWSFGDLELFAGQLVNFEENSLDSKIWQWGPPINFGDELKILDASQKKSLTLYTNANLISISALNGRISQAIFKNNHGVEVRVRANVFILALGGIENARMLLVSNNLANSSGAVGSYFMEHPVFNPANLYLMNGANVNILNYSNRPQNKSINDGVVIKTAPYIYLSEVVQRKAKTLSAFAQIASPEAWESKGVESFNEIITDLKKLKITENFYEKMKDISADVPAVVTRIIRKISGGSFYARYPILMMCEQFPSKKNRIILSNELDIFGIPRVELKWTVGKEEIKTVKEFTLQMSSEFSKLGIGRLKVNKFFDSEDVDLWNENAICRGHHMGSTRMSVSPKQGVVDSSLKSHDLENLYICGSSVFPSSGHVNPTLTIVALALRLAEHIKVKYG
jgi:choline dehydrogenase-like flavoprotein